MTKNLQKVYVGMSGGVDSSVTAALLKHEGYDVTGVYMKNWSQDLPGMVCPWRQDYQDAKRVAVQLGIQFKMYDFEAQYRELVVDYMLEGYQSGITPNPDIMCNQEIKFKLFLETALADGADLIATGHYARTADGKLYTGLDTNKDQTYFLYRVKSEALSRTLLPVGAYTKPQIRQLAADFGLATAHKKDSQGICFVGKVGIREFLQQFVPADAAGMGPGPVIDRTGASIGEHDGALFYTIGQRHGLNVGGGLPYYVIGKNMDRNEVYVTTDLDDGELWSRELVLAGEHWINTPPLPGREYWVRTRHRAPLVKCFVSRDHYEAELVIDLEDQVRALTPGQSAVLYQKDVEAENGSYRVVGGGIVI